MTITRKTFLALAAVLLLVNARQRAVRGPFPSPLDIPPHDPFTFSDPSRVSVSHAALDLTVDFAAKQLRGSATLTIENHTGARTLTLDTNALAIDTITIDGSPTLWSLGEPTNDGAPLTIAIEPSTRLVHIEYATDPGAPGLFWNSAAQSFGRQQPYLYSLNEPTDARSWIPIQDTPAVRMTYEATVHVPPGSLALMSAENNPTATNESGVYTFTMSRSIPAYLIALAVGRLEFRALDERTGVYAEPELIDDAARELAYLPDMVDAGERICGPFPFVRHDILLMPPTFVVGGMEHPMLNFLNPFSTISQNGDVPVEPRVLVAHELAHSWSGDATTLATWNDTWLNEGFASYLSLRILEEVAGVERAELAYVFDRATYAGFAQNNPTGPATILHRAAIPYAGAMFNTTSYTKGELFLRTLEDTLGRPAFDAFLRAYFERFSYRWVDDRNFLDALRSTTELDENALRLHEWLYEPGLPPNVTAPTSSVMYSRVLDRAQRWAGGTPLAQLDPASWTPAELDLFLQVAPADRIRLRMSELDAQFALSTRTAPPTIWLSHAIFAQYAPAYPALERVLMRGGPNGTMVSLYNMLAHTDLERARDIFQRARSRYLESVAAQIEGLLFPGVQSAAFRRAA